jgi:acyl-CoA thioesterase
MTSPEETQAIPSQEEIIQRVAEFGYARLIGMQIVQAQDGQGGVRIKVDGRLMHPQQIVHGGVIFTLADTAMSMALLSILPAGTRFSTVEAKINYLAPVRAGEIVAEATILQQGRTIAVLESTIYNIDGENRRLVGKVLGTFHIASNR